MTNPHEINIKRNIKMNIVCELLIMINVEKTKTVRGDNFQNYIVAI